MSFTSDEEDWNISDEEGEYSDEETIFKPEVTAFERTGYGGILGETKDRALQDPLEKFQIAVDAISRSLNNQNTILSENDIQILLEKANKLKYVYYKNPQAYILGYLASNGGKNIDIKSFKHVSTKILPLLSEGSVLEPDILRYARLWETL
jgi:hypothetical protein